MSTPTLLTARLCLRAANPTLLAAELRSRRHLSRALHARVPPIWPPVNLEDIAQEFALLLDEEPALEGWLGWYWLTRDDAFEGATLIGMGGFKGLPDDAGRVEIGYSTLAPWRRQGLTTEAVVGLVEWASGWRDVKEIIARVMPDNIGSIRVLERAGFLQHGQDEEGDLLFTRAAT